MIVLKELKISSYSISILFVEVVEFKLFETQFFLIRGVLTKSMSQKAITKVYNYLILIYFHYYPFEFQYYILYII